MDYKIDKKKSLQYFKQLKNNYSVSYYRKQVYQILKLLKFFDVSWINEINLPPEPTYYPIHISKQDIDKTIKYFKNDAYKLRFYALTKNAKNAQK